MEERKSVEEVTEGWGCQGEGMMPWVARGPEEESKGELWEARPEGLEEKLEVHWEAHREGSREAQVEGKKEGEWEWNYWAARWESNWAARWELAVF